MKSKKKQILFLVCVALIVIVGIILFLIGNKEESYSSEYKESEREDTFEYDGKEYQYNEHLSNYLFMGVDTREPVTTYETQEDAGQADSIFLLSYNRVEETLKCIAIPRDTLTRIQVLSVDGADMGTTKEHLNLQYAFGDGKTKSCELMIEAVSNMMYGIPIQGYCSLNMDGISIAVGTLGGVELQVPDDTWAEIDPQYLKGTTITITEENAESFIRYRDTKTGQSAIVRMNRQKVFMEAFALRAKEKVSEDTDFIVDMYEALDPYMVTNIGNDVLAKLLDSEFDAETGMIDLPGTGVEGERFDEYHIDEEQLYELILQMFYKEI